MSHQGNDGIVQFEGQRRQRPLPEIQRVEAYWESLRRGRLVPLRSEIDPRGLSGVLENAFVLERIAAGLARFRVAGSQFTKMMGMEVRGMPISAAFTPDGRTKLSDALEAVFAEPACVTLDCVSETGIGRPPLSARMVLLPLRCDLGEVSRVLGALALDGEVGRTPRRLDVAGIEHRTLTGYAEAPVIPARVTPATTPARAQDLADAAAAYAAETTTATPAPSQTPRRKSERPWLRLVHTD